MLLKFPSLLNIRVSQVILLILDFQTSIILLSSTIFKAQIYRHVYQNIALLHNELVLRNATKRTILAAKCRSFSKIIHEPYIIGLIRWHQ